MECGFDKPIAKVSPKVQKICARIPKISKKVEEFVFKKQLIRKYPLDFWKKFRQPNKIIIAKNPKCFPQSLKNKWKFWRFCEKENYFFKHVLWTKRKQFWPPCQKIFIKIPNNFPQIPFVGVTLLEENDNDIRKDHLDECRKQFFKLGWRLCDRSPQSFSSKLEKFVKVNIFFRKHTFFEKFFCSSKMHFWQLLLSFCAKVAESSPHSRKTVKKLNKFIEKTVHSKNSFEHLKCSFDEPFESSYRTRKTFSLNFHRKPWIFSDEKNNLTHSFSFTQLFLTKIRKFFDHYSKKM